MVTTWKDGLIKRILDESAVLYTDNQLTIIKDVYPKSRHHFLAVIRDADLNTLNDLDKSHIQLINHVYQQSIKWTTNIETAYGFKFGFHMVPSMNRLHLHIISMDHDSICLKNRKHYNSFNCDFFMSPESVLNDLKEFGYVKLPPKDELIKLLENQLKCHFCDQIFNSRHAFADLKKHLKSHHDEIDDLSQSID